MRMLQHGRNGKSASLGGKVNMHVAVLISTISGLPHARCEVNLTAKSQRSDLRWDWNFRRPEWLGTLLLAVYSFRSTVRDLCFVGVLVSRSKRDAVFRLDPASS